MRIPGITKLLVCVFAIFYYLNAVAAQPVSVPTQDLGPIFSDSIRFSDSIGEAQPAIPSEAQYWLNRVDLHLSRAGDHQHNDIDALFAELSRAFDYSCRKFQNSSWQTPSHPLSAEAIGSPIYKIAHSREEIFAALNTLYYQRIRLLKSVSSNEKALITGTGIEGIEEVRRELRFLGITMRQQSYELKALIKDVRERLDTHPLHLIGLMLQLILLTIAFGYWFRWAPTGLANIRSHLMSGHAKSKLNFRRIKIIWYFDQVKYPLTWIVILNVFFSLFEYPALRFFNEIARISISWMLFSWAGVLFINAVIARNANALNTENAQLILRSLKYLGVWLVITGLGLQVIARYTGTGTLYSWFLLLVNILLIVLLSILVLLWRKAIKQGCMNEPKQNFITRAVVNDSPGLAGYLWSMAGAIYLLRMYASQKILNMASNFNTGQQVVDSLINLEIARAYHLQRDDPDARPIPPALQHTLAEQNNELLREVGNSLIKSILNQIDEGNGGLVILTGDTGCGKSTILQRINRETESNTLLVSCPRDGIDSLVSEMARKLHMDRELPKRKVVFEEIKRKKIDVLLIDDIHRLVRPRVGGQQQLDQLAEVIIDNRNLLVILALNSATWLYTLRARDNRMFEKNAEVIQAWSAEQVATLIKNSCAAAGIEPDFSNVVIPRQYDNNNYDNQNDRAFTGYIRMLHSAAMGNPKVALGLWFKSLYLNKEEKIIVQLPELPSSEELDRANLTLLLILRVICQTEIIAFEDIIECLQIDPLVAQAALRHAQHYHWVEMLGDNYYQLNWYWRRVITRVLTRKNLLPRML